jgi:RNA polymerase sigma-70 factor (ECF subfamily)
MNSDEREPRQPISAGETARFLALSAEYSERIYRFCHRLCGNSADAEDLTQEVFLAAFQGLPRFQGRSSLATWLYRIALYQWRKMKAARGPETVPLDDERAVAVVGPDPIAAGLSRMSLEEALAALPETWREALLLVKAEGLKCREAAEVLGIPQGTLKYHVHQAVVRLQALLAEDAGEAPAQPAERARPRKEIMDAV